MRPPATSSTMRVEQTPPIRFFTAGQAKFWRAVFDHLIPQHDRTPERRIPIVEPLDERLYRNQGSWLSLRDNASRPRGLSSRRSRRSMLEAEQRFGGEFLYLPQHQQDIGPAGNPRQKAHSRLRLSGSRCPSGASGSFSCRMRIEGYYSHPWAWDEIGFGGPAYPRAYTRLERGEPEPWEVEPRPLRLGRASLCRFGHDRTDPSSSPGVRTERLRPSARFHEEANPRRV